MDFVDVGERRTGAVGDHEIVNHEPIQQVAGHATHLDDPVRVVLQQRGDAFAHEIPPEVRVGEPEHEEHYQHRDDSDCSEQVQQSPAHQKASPIERCSTILSNTPQKPRPTVANLRRVFRVTRRFSPSITASVTTGSVSERPGLIPISTLMGPTGDLYLTPNPGVTAALLGGSSGFVLWPTYPASMKPAPKSCFHSGKRSSALTSATKLPPSGLVWKSMRSRSSTFGSHVLMSAVPAHAGFSSRSFDEAMESTLGPSWFSP